MVVAPFGGAAAGGVFVPVNPLLKPEQVAYILNDCNVRILVTSAERLVLLTTALRNCHDLHAVIVVGATGKLEANASLIILKTTRDESIKTCSPAFLMRQEAFRKLFEEQRIKRIEFCGRLMDLRARWSNEVRAMCHVNYYRWSWLPKIRSMLMKLRMR